MITIVLIIVILEYSVISLKVILLQLALPVAGFYLLYALLQSRSCQLFGSLICGQKDSGLRNHTDIQPPCSRTCSSPCQWHIHQWMTSVTILMTPAVCNEIQSIIFRSSCVREYRDNKALQDDVELCTWQLVYVSHLY